MSVFKKYIKVERLLHFMNKVPLILLSINLNLQIIYMAHRDIHNFTTM